MISLVMPAFNEEKIIKNNVAKALGYLKSNFARYELIIVNDGSTDKTAEVLSDMDISLITLPYNMGKGAALKQGLLSAKGDNIFFTDCDLPYSLVFIKQGQILLKQCDMVCGIRDGGYPALRSVLSAGYNSFARNILMLDVRDLQCGIKGFSKSAAKSICSECTIKGFAMDTEVVFLATQMGFKIAQLDVKVFHRSNSTVKIISDGIEMLADVLKIRNNFEAGGYHTREGATG